MDMQDIIIKIQNIIVGYIKLTITKLHFLATRNTVFKPLKIIDEEYMISNKIPFKTSRHPEGLFCPECGCGTVDMWCADWKKYPVCSCCQYGEEETGEAT